MEQTLGKRIAENRKRLGMTQDTLAEKLGITAQAISKWENDQSCPDITMLPKLAEIFGITTDALLGMEPPKPLHEAEVVEDETASDPDGVHVHNGGWEFHWDNSKRGSITFAILVLLVGLLTLCNQVLGWHASFWGILWPCVLLVYGVEGICCNFSVFKIGMTLIGGVYLLNNLGFLDLDLFGDWIFPVVVILFGLSLLLDALKKPKKPRFVVTHNGKAVGSGSKKEKSSFSTGDDRFYCNLTFGEKTHEVHLASLAGGEASVSFGEMRVDLTGCETIQEGCTIDASCSFGELILLIPRKYRAEINSGTAFASVDTQGQHDAQPEGVIYINGNVSFGEITVKYV